MYPWAVVFVREGGIAMVEMAMFIGILLVGVLYAWRERALRVGLSADRQPRRQAPIPVPSFAGREWVHVRWTRSRATAAHPCEHARAAAVLAACRCDPGRPHRPLATPARRAVTQPRTIAAGGARRPTAPDIPGLAARDRRTSALVDARLTPSTPSHGELAVQPSAAPRRGRCLVAGRRSLRAGRHRHDRWRSVRTADGRARARSGRSPPRPAHGPLGPWFPLPHRPGARVGFQGDVVRRRGRPPDRRRADGRRHDAVRPRAREPGAGLGAGTRPRRVAPARARRGA